ncbi:transcription initiation factor TFIID [Paenibacillus hodogayensis]|uniref:Transcription initiation factor TFIID n=1 Tax=Paenibacillus hodogayensis TaxID=279208 RepID=A0ABV5VQZ6_9BACL
MHDRLQAFARDYDAEADRLALRYDGQSSIRHPLVFLFIGDDCVEALNAIVGKNEEAWHNGKGVVYVHAYTERTVEENSDTGRVLGIRLPMIEGERQTMRPRLHRQFYENTPGLAEASRVARQVGERIAGYGHAYSSFQQLHIAVVAAAHDRCSVLLPEIALLLKTSLADSFKQIQMDLYALMREKREDGDYGFASASAAAFLRELDGYQSRDYRFSAPLHVTGDHIRLPVEHEGRPLFDLVYLLGDKNEQGMLVDGSMDANYAIISRLCLLKNRKQPGRDEAEETYNNQRFKQHIEAGRGQEPVYATAGFSRVKRPNAAVALSALHQTMRQIVSRLKEQSAVDRRTMLELWGLDAAALARRADALVPEADKLEEMNALLFADVSLDELKRTSLAEAEQWLYARHAGEFFREHFAVPAGAALEKLDTEREVRATAERTMMHHPDYGLYGVYAWTSTQEDGPLYQELRAWRKDVTRQLEQGRLELDRLLQETVDMQPFRRVPLMKRSTLKHFARYLFESVYGRRLELLRLETRLALIARYEEAFARLHARLSPLMERLSELDKQIAEASRRSVSEADDYLGRNIAEYYAVVVDGLFKELQARRGDDFPFGERGIGSVAELLENGAEPLLERLIAICRNDLFPSAPFLQSFEDELIHRANVTVRFEDRDRILSKEQLYRELYGTLKEQAAVHIEVYNYTFRNRYEEHYFFGDGGSDFIRYALAAELESRGGKPGCVHEPGKSGVEKLTLMGGFRIEDVLAYRNGQKYYDSYRANGFEFHAAEPGGRDAARDAT